MTQIFFDTNIFIRLFVRDIENQFQAAKEMFTRVENGDTTGVVSILVINEIIWILDNYYQQERSVYIPQLLKILALKNIKIHEVEKHILVKILEYISITKFDFTDVYLFNVSQGKEILSFDKDFKRISA